MYMTKRADHCPLKKVEENTLKYLGTGRKPKGLKQMKVSLE